MPLEHDHFGPAIFEAAGGVAVGSNRAVLAAGAGFEAGGIDPALLERGDDRARLRILHC
ncbi:MAG: hypothetical protein ABIR77_00140 [Sphingomicrobium sp.]